MEAERDALRSELQRHCASVEEAVEERETELARRLEQAERRCALA